MNGNHFLLSSMKQVILKQKWKIISRILLLLYDLIHIHIESFLYLWKHNCQTWGSLYREKYKNCFLKMGRNSYKYGETNNVSKFVINSHWPSSWVCNMLKMKEHSQKLTIICFKKMLSYVLNLIRNEKMWLTSIFGTSIS